MMNDHAGCDDRQVSLSSGNGKVAEDTQLGEAYRHPFRKGPKLC